MAKVRILFLYDHAAPFVETDLAILRERFEVTPLDCSAGTSLAGLLGPLRESDMSFSWFALGHAVRAVLLGKVLRRPSVVVAGGWDVVAFPEISYGSARTLRGRVRARLILRHADRVLTFSSWSQQVIRKLSKRNPDLVYLGVDTANFAPVPVKEDLVVTVGNVTRENLVRKGLESFVRAAARVPHARFVLAGAHRDDAVSLLRNEAPPNLEMPGWLSDEELRELLGRARVYVQVSYNEGFGLTVAEAMAAGCVPVVTRAGSLPEVVGETGLYVAYGDPVATSDAIERALVAETGAQARHRVERLFSIEKRRDRLHSVVADLAET